MTTDKNQTPKAPNAVELSEAELAQASGGKIWNEDDLWVKGDKTKPAVDSFGELDPWPRDGSKTSKT
jgi:hypothetical protein